MNIRPLCTISAQFFAEHQITARSHPSYRHEEPASPNTCITLLDIMAVTASAGAAQSTAACAGPAIGEGLLRRQLATTAALRSRQGSIDLPPCHIVDDVSRLKASHNHRRGGGGSWGTVACS
jgi:hypothetical protein